jgi:AcrR family transcriptional regulator
MNVTLMNAAYHHGDLRNALVAAAVQLVERGGEASFSLREAAREVEVSPNAAYRHFDDKSALMTAAAAEGSDKLA